MSLNTTTRRKQQFALSLREKAYRDAFVAAEINTTLPFQVRAMRKARGWSQADLAKRTEQAQKTISDFENPNYGKLTLTSLKRLAAAFDVGLVVRFVPFSELVDWTASMSHQNMEVPSFDADKRLADAESDELSTYSTTSSTVCNVGIAPLGNGEIPLDSATFVYPPTVIAPAITKTVATAVAQQSVDVQHRALRLVADNAA